MKRSDRSRHVVPRALGQPYAIAAALAAVIGTFSAPTAWAAVGLCAMDTQHNSATATSCEVPPGVEYVTITITGGSGGWALTEGRVWGGHGAKATGSFAVTPGEILRFAAGMRGSKPQNGSDDWPQTVKPTRGGGGGGASYLYNETESRLLVVAGGGGGGGPDGFRGGHGGVDDTGLDGADGRAYSGVDAGNKGFGGRADGTGGAGGTANTWSTKPGAGGTASGLPNGGDAVPGTFTSDGMVRPTAGGGGGAGFNLTTMTPGLGGKATTDDYYGAAPGGAGGGGEGGYYSAGGGGGYAGGGGSGTEEPDGNWLHGGGGGGGSSYKDAALTKVSFVLPSVGEPGDSGEDTYADDNNDGAVRLQFGPVPAVVAAPQAIPVLSPAGLLGLTGVMGLAFLFQRRRALRQNR